MQYIFDKNTNIACLKLFDRSLAASASEAPVCLYYKVILVSCNVFNAQISETVQLSRLILKENEQHLGFSEVFSPPETAQLCLLTDKTAAVGAGCS